MDDVRRFVDHYRSQALEVAARYGFAVPRDNGSIANPEARTYMVRNRHLRATMALTELQQWLDDDDPGVRSEARRAIQGCLRVGYTVDRPDTDPGLVDRLIVRRLDAFLERTLRRKVDADRPEPRWTRPTNLRRVRLSLIVSAAISVAVAAILLQLDRPIGALVALVVAGTFDVAEGSFARVMRARDAQMRWLSCIVSHTLDLLLLLSIFLAALSTGRSGAELLLLATLASLFASLVRVSALQVGFRFWRSPMERLVRFGAFAGYCIAVMVGADRVGLLTIFVLLLAFSIGEIIRVIVNVSELGVERGGFIFLTDQSVECWSFEEDLDESSLHTGRWDTPAGLAP